MSKTEKTLKTKEEIKKYNREKKQEERKRKKLAGLPISSSEQVIKSRKSQAEKGLKKIEILSVDQETEKQFKDFMWKSSSKTKAQALKKLLKIANDNSDFWIV